MQALVYDVHGNLPALEAVLNDAEDVDRFILGGDYALFGGWPLETIERLRELPALWIRGNGERWTANPSDIPDNPILPGAIAAARQALGDQLVADLAGLPFSATDGDTLIVHGSPVSDVRSFLPEPSQDEQELLEGVTAKRLIFGHTHLAFRRQNGIELINPGSVGMPFDGDTRAAYALVHDDGTVEHRRVAYDHQASAAKVRNLQEDWTETIARRIEQARP
ncbi:metallophosphoesterase family protein [Solirubrobacter soli]|uniref:metallophosphoesterase family protein n=1 Tax=Solirubrobacter soli TaxID=363832 RepID=UPI00041DC0C3|nr:metallophosphoesterase family protein [Solirubrobacter soli]